MYTEKRVEEVLDTFTEVLSKADNFPRDNDPSDYKQFWTALRKEGANLLGVSRYLYGRVSTEDTTSEKEKA
jgi:hypothetical protein|tara:strand:+ start:233 stop:445 length:213 start_codon:yes stop_codon:yes gene_type:complete